MSGALHRLGRFAADHRLLMVLLWLAVVIPIVAWVHLAGAKTNNTLTLPGTDSQAAFDLLASDFPPQQNGTNPFVFHVAQGKLSDPSYAAAIDATYKGFQHSPYVASVRNPLGKNADIAGIISDDGATGIMPVLLNVSSGFITDDLAHRVLAVTAPARKAGVEVAVGGQIGAVLSAPDTKTSTLVGNLAAMVILAFVFGSLIAMGLPIATAAVGLTISTAIIGLLGHLTDVPTVAPTLAIMIGLGVGIDYALFLITRHQELLGRGVEMRESIATSVSSSGTAIVFAGGTVVIALASLAVAGIPLVTMLGVASAIAVALAVLTSLTLLPAILSLVGGGVNRLRIPSFLNLPPRPEGRRRWEVWARWVTSHPWTAIGLSGLILLPLLLPLLSLELGQPDVGVAPTSTTQRKAYDLTTHGFGVGANGPLLIAMSLDPVATPSQEYTSKDNEALALQKELEATQKSLEKQQASLKRQQKQLEAQQKTLEAHAASLKRQQASLERQAETLQAGQDQVKREAERIAAQARKLARKILPLEAHLHALEARERLLKRRIAHTTDPNTLARLRARLARVRAREKTVRAELAPLLQKARALEAQARALAARERQLAAQAADLQRQKQVLEAQASHLEDQERTLERQATKLRRQADDLRRQADAAKKKKQHALDLKQQLTVMLTKAGGNPLGTDPRIVAVQDAVTATSDVAKISPPLINDDGSAAVMNAVPAEAPSSDQTAELVTVLRVQTLPAATGSNGVQAHVGGTTATYVDLARTIAARMPIVILTVLALSFVFLMVVFRSLLVPVQACVTNLLCVGAALGVLTAVFQWGWGLSGIGLHAPEGTVPIASYVPLMMFAVLFGLSMDYEVFTVSRIQQRAAAGADPRTAVTTGVGGAARVVTSAALIMFFVFASFVLNGDPTIKQFGIGLATAVFLAGTMSVLLVPAMLTLFGRRLFWLPAWLGRILPHLDVEGGDDAGQPVVAGGEMESASP